MRDLIFRCLNDVKFVALGDETGDDNLWRKELCYEGTFVKVNDKGETQFELPVDEHRIDQWVRTFNQMQKDGIDVPVPLGHTTDPEARRGTVMRLSKEPSDHPSRKGKPALFCYVKFSKPEYADQFKDSDVSLFMPQEFTSGVGKTYKQPIRHVAITDYPVVPALSKFESVQAALELSLAHEEETKMPSTLMSMAKKMGLKGLKDDMDDSEVEAAIMSAWNAGLDAEDGDPEDEDDDEGKDEELDDEEFEGDGDDDVDPEEFEGDGDDDEDDRMARGRNYEPPPSLSHDYRFPKTMVTQLSRSRSLELSHLVQARKISNRARKELEKIFCGPRAVEFALSHEMQYPGESGDDFDKIVAALSLNSAIARVGERTGHQASRAHSGDGPSPIVAQAEERRKAHEARHRRHA